MERSRCTFSSVLLLLTCLCVCEATSPFIAWSNREVFPKDPKEDIDIPVLVSDISNELKKLNFIIVFTTSRLDFDDIARYGGLYGDDNAPLAPLQTAVVSSASSVWGGTTQPETLIEELSYSASVTHDYLTSPSNLRQTSYLQLLIMELPDGQNRDQTLTQHGSMIADVLKTLESFSASYAAFYTAMPTHSMAKRSNPSSAHSFTAQSNNSNNTSNRCDNSAAVFQLVNKTSSYCTLLCMHALRPKSENASVVTAVYWPSWVNADNSNLTATYCNMSTFEFIPDSGSCSNSSLQDEFLNSFNATSTSISARLNGSCNLTGVQEDLQLEVEFIFISGGSAKTPLPSRHILPQHYWTMQLRVRNITNGVNHTTDTHYLTRFRQDLKKNDTGITERRGLFYPFIIPFGISYACTTHKNYLYTDHGNLNRFVPTRLPFRNDTPNVTDGPVLQFVGLHVESFGKLFIMEGKNNTTLPLPVFSSVYECEGYFDISSWTGTFVVVIVTVMLYLATLALFSTQTPDRFDDPRGQTISIDNLH